MDGQKQDSSLLGVLRAEAEHCTNCDLFRNATQTVFGEGKAAARLMLVGEQPGDEEDRVGKPFVGPAGGILRRAIDTAGLKLVELYVTNAVKHFKWIPRGKRRIHQKPNLTEIKACTPWLSAEMGVVRPQVIICLGATAARSVIGKEIRITKERGTPKMTKWNVPALITFHPSAVLRVPDPEDREKMFKLLVEDLRAADALAKRAEPQSEIPAPR